MPQRVDPGSYQSPEGERPAISTPIELAPRTHDPYAAFRFGDFSLFTAGNLLSITGRLMLAVAVEWEVYARTHSATALGLVGLVIVVPVVTLSLPAGHLADRFSRKRIILVSQIFSVLTSLALALVSWKHLAIPAIAPLRGSNRVLAAIAGIFERHYPIFHFDDASIPLIYLLLFLGAVARTFSWAARSSFFPTLISRDAFANAVTWNNSVFQIGSVVGPALSGLLVAYIGFSFVYLLDALCALCFFLLILPIRRSKQRGKTLLWCVSGFGIATILFGLSKVFWLSLGVLFLVGAFDSVSVIIRGSIVQLITPDEMRGRVSSVNNIFIGTSNEFGALESGLTAALFGPVVSIVAGGIGTIFVLLGVAWRWPETRKIGALDRTLR